MDCSVDWLHQQYVDLGLDCVQIGKIVGRDPKTVWAWLRKHGIPTRPRGGNASTNLQRGRPNGFKHTLETRKKLREARKLDGRFPKNADGTPYWKGKFAHEHPTWTGGTTPERQSFYGTREWKDACRFVWSRANACCERCNKKHTKDGDPFHVHHIMPFAFKKWRASAPNLALLCATCHRFVHGDANGNREFLPPFGVYPLPDSGRLVRISYRPKVKGRLPEWLQTSK